MKARGFVAALALLVVIGSQSSALAHDRDPSGVVENPLRIGAEGALVVPTGDWGDFAGIGFGALARLDYFVNEHLALTARPGYTHHLSETLQGIDFTYSSILLTGGVRGYVTPEVFLSGETGINLGRFKASANGFSETDSETRVPLLVGGGYTAPSGLTASAHVLVPNLLLQDSGEDTHVGVMVNVGFVTGL